MKSLLARVFGIGRPRAAAALAALCVGAVGLAPVSLSPAAAAAIVQDDAATDSLIMRDGKVIRGQILEETADRVKMLVVYAGMKAPVWYDKAEILSITRGAETAGEAAAAAEPQEEQPAEEAATEADATGPVIFTIPLTGQFGRDIAAKPVQQAVDRAERHEPDYLVFELNNDWTVQGQEIGEFGHSFDQYSVAEKIVPIYTSHIQTHWEKQPQVVFWVKQAMGGASFLPLPIRSMYFHPDGHLGGIGDLGEMFEGVGDESVRQKQRSLRRGRARGLAIQGGYDPKLVDALAIKDYVLSVSFEGGNPVYHEREPENPGETLLTDDGSEEDSLEDLVRYQGKNVLTLDAEWAAKLGISDGTAASMDELLYSLGIRGDFTLLDSDGKRVMDDWSKGLARSERSLPKMWEEFNEVQIGGDWRERRAARGQRQRIAREMIRVLNEYDGSIVPGRIGVPDVTQLNVIIEQLRLEQMRDTRD